MKTGGFVVCPACGTRNKTAWEFCVRCGESLEGAETPAVERRGEASSEAAEGGTDWRAWGGSLLLIAIGVAAFLYIRGANATTAPPTAGLLTVPTQPSQPAAPRPTPPPPAGPGAKDFAEGLRLVRAGQYADALPFLASAAETEPGNGLYLSTWGQALWENGDHDEALERYRQAAETSTDYAISYVRVLEQAGRSAEALAKMDELVAAGELSGPVRDEFAHMLYRAGKYDKALPLLEDAALRAPGDVLTQQELAYAASQAGDQAKAEEIYRRILAKRPDASVTRANLAEALSKQGKPAEAEALLREGLASGRSSAVLHATLGRLLDSQGKTQEALAEYKQAARVGAGTEYASQVAARIAALEGRGPAGGQQ